MATFYMQDIVAFNAHADHGHTDIIIQHFMSQDQNCYFC